MSVSPSGQKRKARDSNPHDLAAARFSKPARQPVSGCPPYRVDPAGVEPALPARQAGVFPLDHGPVSIRVVEYSRQDSNLRLPGCEPGAVAAGPREHANSLGWNRTSGPGGGRTHIPLFKRQVLRQLSYKASQCVGQELNLHSNAGGLQPLGLANAQPTRQYPGWDLNPPRNLQECPAGVEPACPVWKTVAWAARPRAQGRLQRDDWLITANKKGQGRNDAWPICTMLKDQGHNRSGYAGTVEAGWPAWAVACVHWLRKFD